MTNQDLQAQIEELRRLLRNNDRAGFVTKAESLWSAVDTKHAELSDSEKNSAYSEILQLRHSASIEIGDAKTALEFAQQAYDYAVLAQNELVIANSISQIAIAYGEMSDFEPALEYYKKALEIYERLDNKAGIARSIGNIGVTYFDKSDYRNSLEYILKAIELNKAIDRKEGISANLTILGLIYRSAQDLPRALEAAKESLAINEALGRPRYLAIDHGNIALIYHQIGDWQQAVEYNLKSIEYYNQVGGKDGIIRCYSNLANAYERMANNELALEYHRKSLTMSEELGRLESKSITLGNIGQLFGAQGDFAESLPFLLQALEIDEQLGIGTHIATCLLNLGTWYAHDENPDQDLERAEEYLVRAEKTALDTGGKDSLLSIYSNLLSIYEKQERWEEAFRASQNLSKLVAEQQVDESKRQLLLFDVERKMAEREKEIAEERAVAAMRIEEQRSLLQRVLPASIADRLLKGEQVADYFHSVSLFFADIVDFTPLAATLPATTVLSFLSHVFGEFDRVMKKHGCQKVKTIGDGYMAVAGAPIECDDHAERIAAAALELMSGISLPEQLRSTLPENYILQLRVGLHTGPVVAGIVGDEGFVYDFYSDAVNLAARMESTGTAAKIHCSSDFAEHLQRRNAAYALEERGEVEVKGIGKMRTYYLHTEH